MKVFLGGSVNGSTWRDYVIAKLKIDYFNPVVDDWNDEAIEKEFFERRHCNYVLYVLTPKMNGFYTLAEAMDDSYKRPDRTIFCYLKEDGSSTFGPPEIASLEKLGYRLEKNGATWLKSLDEVADFLNSGGKQGQSTTDLTQKTYDCFISYGRKHSLKFVQTLKKNLLEDDYEVWFDDSDIPLEIGDLEGVNGLIEKSKNFLFIISPHAIRSEYCMRELEYALSLGKRIVPLFHRDPGSQWDKIPSEVKMLGTLPFQSFLDHDLQSYQELKSILDKRKDYIEQHTDLLEKFLSWQRSGKQDSELLYSKERKKAQDWRHTQFFNEKPPCSAKPELLEFIDRSLQLDTSTRILFSLNKRFSFITSHPKFDKVIGFISMGNPLSLLPQLIILFTMSRVEGISVAMWSLFVLIQASFCLVGIKQKNLGMFISMSLSMLISMGIIILTLIKSS